VERAFTAAERGKVTILIGGMTWKHDYMFLVSCPINILHNEGF